MGAILKHPGTVLKVLALYLGQKSSRQFDLWFRQTARWTILLLLAVGIGSWAVVVHRGFLIDRRFFEFLIDISVGITVLKALFPVK